MKPLRTCASPRRFHGWWWWVAAAFAVQLSAWAAWLVLAAHHPVATVPLVGFP
ncbi:MAG TPA: hypothetical protein VG838_03455 [Opitutaceae bacterium]|nr:hypothetical protein [Opitutaceae bacterium]HWB96483.1 hypothetical protein [Bryobacteraceae bacterium]